VVDQTEELVTQTPPDAREHFVALLAAATAGPVRVVATMRPGRALLTPLPGGTWTVTRIVR
jgi:hypothetical protein